MACWVRLPLFRLHARHVGDRIGPGVVAAGHRSAGGGVRLLLGLVPVLFFLLGPSGPMVASEPQEAEAAIPVPVEPESEWAEAIANPSLPLVDRIEAARRWVEASPEEPRARFVLGRFLYLKGVSDRKFDEQMKEAESVFESLSRSQGQEPLYRAYWGSTLLVRSDRTWAFWKKGELAKRAGLLIDKAVEEAPESVEIRYVRGISTRHLPDWMGRSSQSAEDLAWVALRLDGGAALMPRLASSAYLAHGENLADDGKAQAARRAWEKAMERCEVCPSGVEAARRMKRGG